MLKLLSYNKSRIILKYTDCNSINLDRVQSVSLNRLAGIDCDISSPIVTFDLDQSLSFLKGEETLVLYDNLNYDDFTQVTVSIKLSGNYSIEQSNVGNNKIIGSGIKADFSISNTIEINDTLYNIDRDYSTENELILTTPLVSTSNNYNTIFNDPNYLFPLETLKIKAKDVITKISCTNCKEIDSQYNYVMRFMSLQQALNCNDKQTALELYNFLKLC